MQLLQRIAMVVITVIKIALRQLGLAEKFLHSQFRDKAFPEQSFN